jgi:adenylate cyclase
MATILIVDDEAPHLRTLAKVFKRERYEVVCASTGTEALEKLRSHDIHLVVTDLMMPRKDGLTLVKDMKNDERLSRVPTIILTAKSSPKDVIAGIKAGARHYLTKPFKPDELISKVKKVLNIP